MPPLLSAQNVMTHLILHSNLPKPLTNQADRATLHKLLDKSTQNREDYQTNIQKMESMLKRTRQLIQEVREKAIKGRAENERLSMQVREKLRVVERVMREYGEMGAEEERRREIGR
jgi:Txe/YoeB family toxin of Txe-Axe toxin-antitoxin module